MEEDNSQAWMEACSTESRDKLQLQLQLVYTDNQSLPDLETAFAGFKERYPRYTETTYMEAVRVREYEHLEKEEEEEEERRVCLDYCGFGLFTYLQQMEDWESASFHLSPVTASEMSFSSHVQLGAPKLCTVVEYDLRHRIMDYLNIQDSEYSMIFTATRGSSFKLLAHSYPFGKYCKRLITMYDYESESVGWLVQRAKEKGTKLSDISFQWPSLRVASQQLLKLLTFKGKHRSRKYKKGLFVFPVQSRVSGTKYSYQWMSLAQQNNWHVLLDASSLGPKDMDSLALSLFKPDFIIASFYKVFGADPSGFACLFIKNTALHSLQQDQSSETAVAASGIVRIIPIPCEWSSSGSSEHGGNHGDGSMAVEDNESASTEFEFPKSSQLFPIVASFSGPMLGFDHLLSSPEGKSVRVSEEEEEDDDDLTGELSCSPAFSPSGSVLSQTSMTEEGLVSDHLSVPIHDSVCTGQVNDLPESEEERSKDPHEIINGFSMGREQHMQEESSSGVAAENNVIGAIHTIIPLSANLPMDANTKTLDSSSLKNLRRSDGVLNISTQNSCYTHDQDKEVGFNEDKEVGFNRCLQILQNQTEENQDDASRQKPSCSSRYHDIENDDPCLLGRSLSPFRENPEDLGTSYIEESEDTEEISTQEEEEEDDDDDEGLGEPKIVCRSLDHADMLGLNKATLRLRCLVNWLIDSLHQLRHENCKKKKPLSLVHVYGPQATSDRGASIAFNVYDSQGKLVHPELVQMLADKNKISLSIGFLRNIQLPSNEWMSNASEDETKVLKGLKLGKVQQRIQVVSAALSFLSTFEDVYRLWLFAASFLDVHYVSKQLGGHKTKVFSAEEQRCCS